MCGERCSKLTKFGSRRAFWLDLVIFVNRLESGDFVAIYEFDIMPLTVGWKVMMDHSARRPGASAILTHGLEAKLMARHVR